MEDHRPPCRLRHPPPPPAAGCSAVAGARVGRRRSAGTGRKEDRRVATGRGDVGGHGRVADNVGRPSSNFFISVAE